MTTPTIARAQRLSKSAADSMARARAAAQEARAAQEAAEAAQALAAQEESERERAGCQAFLDTYGARVKSDTPDLAAAFAAYRRWREAQAHANAIAGARNRAFSGVGRMELARGSAAQYPPGDAAPSFDAVLRVLVAEHVARSVPPSTAVKLEAFRPETEG